MTGIILGGSLSWWLSRPTPPWMHFDWLTATYVPGNHEILLNGRYFVERECHAPVIWRQEARATDGQIAQYGPAGSVPDLSAGRQHDYSDKIALTAEIFPDGWRVLIIVTCTAVPQETIVSPSTEISILGPIAPGL